MSCFGQNEKRFLPTVALELPTLKKDKNFQKSYFNRTKDKISNEVKKYRNNIIKRKATKKPLDEWLLKWCRVSESNQGHRDFQSLALPTELTRLLQIQINMKTI